MGGFALELRHLRCFIAVAEEGSLTNAAERRLHTAQPSLSRQIRDLESGIGAKLIERRARGIALTPAGRVFLDHARPALMQIEVACEAATGHRLARNRVVRPQDLARERFISTARVAAVLRTVIDDYATKAEIRLKQNYDAEILSGGMSLVASTGGFTLLPLYVRNALIPSVVARPLRGEVPTIDLVMGYNKSNTSPLLKRFLRRADDLVHRGAPGEAYSRTSKRGDRKLSVLKPD